jgi:hypothetical protein
LVLTVLAGLSRSTRVVSPRWTVLPALAVPTPLADALNRALGTQEDRLLWFSG